MDYNVLFIRIIVGLAIYYLGYYFGARKALKIVKETMERELGRDK